MVAEVVSGMVHGIEGELISVQADISDGLPLFYMIGYLSNEVKEAKDRVRTALKNSGFHLPAKRIAVNLAPADFKKSGTYFDVAVAVGLFVAMGLLSQYAVKDMIILGELSLDGTIAPLQGVLPILWTAKQQGYTKCLIPMENREEAGLLDGLEIYSFSTLKELFLFFSTYDGSDSFGREQCYRRPFGEQGINQKEAILQRIPDFSEVKGQQLAKRALEIAAAGYHNVFLHGSPGSGKSLMASCLPGIMPDMTVEEQLDVTVIYSVKGMLKEQIALMKRRPFRAPSHSVTIAGMFGGGANPKPGEISLAHHGVLFLDELPEYKRDFIEKFRVPLEEHKVTLVRQERTVTFPSDILLLTSANPCPCGYYPDRNLCHCPQFRIDQYQGKISGPILDRMDLFVRCDKLSYQEMTADNTAEEHYTSEKMKQRVEAAWKLQRVRLKEDGMLFNGRMRLPQIRKYCKLDSEGEKLMEYVYEKMHLTGRAYHKVLKTARTIADLEESEQIKRKHLEEALLFRRVHYSEWN